MDDVFVNAFITTRPEEVARKLHAFPLEEILEFLSETEVTLAAQVLSKTESHLLQRILAQADRTWVATVLTTATEAQAKTLIAHIPASDYQSIFEAASDVQKPSVERLLQLGGITVADYTLHRFVRTTSDRTCIDLKTELERTTDVSQDMPVFVIDAEGRYAGMVALFAVVATQNAERKVSDFVFNVQPLHGESSVSSVLKLSEWTRYPILPVVDASGYLLGAVRFEDLLSAESASVQGSRSKDTAFELVDLYMGLCADTVDVLIRGGGNRQRTGTND